MNGENHLFALVTSREEESGVVVVQLVATVLDYILKALFGFCILLVLGKLYLSAANLV